MITAEQLQQAITDPKVRAKLIEQLDAAGIAPPDMEQTPTFMQPPPQPQLPQADAMGMDIQQLLGGSL